MGRHGTIAGRKAAQDSKRAAMFTKYAKAITVAAKDGGDPDAGQEGDRSGGQRDLYQHI